jgi:hypothetical protein
LSMQRRQSSQQNRWFWDSSRRHSGGCQRRIARPHPAQRQRANPSSARNSLTCRSRKPGNRPSPTSAAASRCISISQQVRQIGTRNHASCSGTGAPRQSVAGGITIRRLTIVTEAAGASGWKQSAHTVADRAACLRKAHTSSAVREPWSSRSWRARRTPAPASFRSQSITDKCQAAGAALSSIRYGLACALGGSPLAPRMPQNATETGVEAFRRGGSRTDADPAPSVLVWHPGTLAHPCPPDTPSRPSGAPPEGRGANPRTGRGEPCLRAS